MAKQYIEKFDSIGAEAAALFEGRSASKESVEDARSYVRKLQGRKLGAAKPKTDENGNPVLDESEKGISAAQTSAAAKISTMYELIDFLKAQPKYAEVNKPGFTAAELRALRRCDANQTRRLVGLGRQTLQRPPRAKQIFLPERRQHLRPSPPIQSPRRRRIRLQKPRIQSRQRHPVQKTEIVAR